MQDAAMPGFARHRSHTITEACGRPKGALPRAAGKRKRRGMGEAHAAPAKRCRGKMGGTEHCANHVWLRRAR
jgi:hypothetical protein